MLEDTVRSVLACSSAESSRCQFVVIDNASTDDTRDRMMPFVNAGRLSYVHEPRPGLSVARNTAATVSTGEWLLYLDDDVLVEPNFLDQYLAAIDSLPDASFLGGPIRPEFDEPISPAVAHISSAYEWCFSALDLGPPQRVLDQDVHPYGANMAVRRELVQRHPFRTDLGFKHGSLVPGEETAFFHTLTSAGLVGYWIPTASVRHRVPVTRTRLSYVFRRGIGQGREEGIKAYRSGRSSLWAIRSIITEAVRLPFTVFKQPGATGLSVFQLLMLMSLFRSRYLRHLDRTQE
jgi:glycosyltransferase involved in cell wall biosynthesis